MFFLTVVVVLAALSAQTLEASEPPALTEAEFLAVAEDHPALMVLNEGTGLAGAEVIRARTLENPELEFVREAPSGAAEELDLTVGWQLPRRAWRRLSITAAESAVEAAGADTLTRRLELHLALRQVFAEWAVAAARAERSRVHVERVAELARQERHRAERGEASGLAARRLELAVAAGQTRLALAEAEALRAEAEALGWRPDLDAGTVAILPDLPQPTAAPARGHSPFPPWIPPRGHSRLTALTAEVEAARLDREAAEHVLPWPKIMAGWKREEEAGKSAQGLTLGFSWPLGVADRRRAERHAARTRHETAAARLELVRGQIEAERAGALAAYERLFTATAAVRQATNGNARLVEAAATSFRYGELSLTDLLETLRSAFEAELAVLDLHAAALAAHRGLEAATGTLPSDP